MAWLQGIATIRSRKDQIHIAAGSVVRGARLDWRGIWTGATAPDFDAFSQVVSLSGPDETLGRALRAALRASRINIPRPAAWANGIGSDRAEFSARLAAAFGLPDARRLYPGMRCCGVGRVLGEVRLNPTRRRHAGEFEVFQRPWAAQHPDVVLPWRASDADLGAAMRLCLERCL